MRRTKRQKFRKCRRRDSMSDSLVKVLLVERCNESWSACGLPNAKEHQEEVETKGRVPKGHENQGEHPAREVRLRIIEDLREERRLVEGTGTSGNSRKQHHGHRHRTTIR